MHDCLRQDLLFALNVFDGLGERVQAAHDQRLLGDPALSHLMAAGVVAQLLVNLGREIRLDANAVSHDRCLVGTDRKTARSNRERPAREKRSPSRNRANRASGINESAVPERS